MSQLGREQNVLQRAEHTEQRKGDEYMVHDGSEESPGWGKTVYFISVCSSEED